MMMQFVGKELNRLIRKAKRLAKDGREICGFLVHNGHFIEIVETRNESRKMGHFKVNKKQYDRIKKAIRTLHHNLTGSFHSHPVSEAQPGPGDIKGSENNSLMLIIDCIGNEAKLWRIKDKKAREIKYKIIDV